MPRALQTAFASVKPRSPAHALPGTDTTLCGQVLFVMMILTGRQTLKEEVLPDSVLFFCGKS